MINQKRQLVNLALVLAFLLPWAAQGKVIFIEPYLGYSKLSLTMGTVSDDAMAAILGGKGGINLGRGLFFGLDYHTGGPYELDKVNLELVNTMFGGGVGWSSSKARWWLGYYWSNEFEDANQFLIYRGTGLKASLGFTFKSKLSVNFEYVLHDFEKLSSLGQDTEVGTFDSSVFFLSISSPLNFNP